VPKMQEHIQREILILAGAGVYTLFAIMVLVFLM
jgi:hypothetical protein